MCYDYGGSVAHEAFESFLHETFAFRVKSLCSFVEDKDRRIFEDSACDAYALSLSAG